MNSYFINKKNGKSDLRSTNRQLNSYKESFVFMDESEYEFFEERAAIMEFNGDLNREKAEWLAYQRILQNREVYARAS